jgi:hypothetical protein
MKILFFSIFTAILYLSMTKCTKEAPLPPPPVDGGLDSNQVFLNGQLSDFVGDFKSYYPQSNNVTCGFRQRRGDFVNYFDISGPVPIAPGEWGKFLGFGQLHGYDQHNHKYALDTSLKPVFTITAFDKSAKRIKGAFHARFYRTSTGKETPDSFLPDTLEFKGTYNTVWRDY